MILSGINGNVIMSGCGDDNPDEARREANRDYSRRVSRRADGVENGRDPGAKRAAVLPPQAAGLSART